MKTLLKSIILASTLLLSCVSQNNNEITTRNVIGNFKPNVLITGVGETGEVAFYTNSYFIAGIFPKNSESYPELIEILDELELETCIPSINNRVALTFEIGTTEAFGLIKKKNSKPFNQKDSHALEILRKKYRRFGPIFFNSNKQIQGVFNNKIDVLIDRTADKSLIDSIVSKYSAEIATYYYVDYDILYSIKLSPSIGYEIVEIAKEIAKYPSVISAVPNIDVIINPNP